MHYHRSIFYTLQLGVFMKNVFFLWIIISSLNAGHDDLPSSPQPITINPPQELSSLDAGCKAFADKLRQESQAHNTLSSLPPNHEQTFILHSPICEPQRKCPPKPYRTLQQKISMEVIPTPAAPLSSPGTTSTIPSTRPHHRSKKMKMSDSEIQSTPIKMAQVVMAYSLPVQPSPTRPTIKNPALLAHILKPQTSSSQSQEQQSTHKASTLASSTPNFLKSILNPEPYSPSSEIQWQWSKKTRSSTAD